MRGERKGERGGRTLKICVLECNVFTMKLSFPHIKSQFLFFYLEQLRNHISEGNLHYFTVYFLDSQIFNFDSYYLATAQLDVIFVGFSNPFFDSSPFIVQFRLALEPYNTTNGSIF